jgi:predicted secreted protein with PEFG-CTERM motif
MSNLKIFTLLAIIIASISGGSAFAQMSEPMLAPISVTTDKDSYADGDTVVISGEVRDLLSGTPVSLQVIAANGNIVGIEQLDVGADHKFSTEITAGGGLWKSKGTYTVKVLYGTQARTAETTFEFGGSGGGTAGTTVKVDRTDFVLSYKITGGDVKSVTPDDKAKSLVIMIEAREDGQLIITLPRALIDAKINGEDDDFFVLIDGEEVEFEEETTAIDRKLTINFPAGAEEIEIIGTMVVPEFGTIAALILAIAIISIIAVSAKTRLSILPKY